MRRMISARVDARLLADVDLELAKLKHAGKPMTREQLIERLLRDWLDKRE
jgi:hypothetical protein